MPLTPSRIIASIILCWYVSSCQIKVWSAPTPDLAKRPPQVYAGNLGEKEVQELIDHIDAPRAAATLKLGYFGKRVDWPLPPEEGLKLLDKAVAVEPLASRRWFILKNVRAYASFRVLGANPQEGLAAYNDVFAHANDATKSDSGYFVLQSVNDLLFNIQGRFRDIGLRQDPATAQALAKAWDAYEIAVTQTGGRKFVLGSFPWSQAVAATSSESAFLPRFQQALQDPTLKDNYDIVFAAAVANSKSRPDFSIDLLEKSMHLLPQSNKESVAQYYNLLVDLYEKRGDSAKAILAQQKKVASIGHGYGRLLQLYLDNGREEQAKEILVQVRSPQIDEREIVAVADSLRIWIGGSASRYSEWRSPLEQMLTSYLNGDRNRKDEEDLHARVLLGTILIADKRFGDARTIVDVKPNQGQPTRHTRSLADYNRLQELKQLLDDAKKE